MQPEYQLTNGDALVVSVLAPGDGRGTTARHLEIHQFLARPFDPSWGKGVDSFLERFLAGTADVSLADTLIVGRIDDVVVGTVWHATHRESGELGGYGYVLTHPAHRGKGIAQRLTELSIQRFWDSGGQASYLGTANPIAEHIYKKSGYAPFNGMTMRAVRPGTDPASFDDQFFARDGEGEIRDIELGDIGAYTGLLMTPKARGWIVRDFSEAIFYAPPAIESAMCLRPFYNSFARKETNPSNVWKVLINACSRLVCSANLFVPTSMPLSASATLEFQTTPAYLDRTTAVIDAVLNDAATRKIRTVRAYAITTDRQDVLSASGFVTETVRMAELDLGDHLADLTVMRRDLT
jgi:GNAT superfamily N-acetyltransferase